MRRDEIRLTLTNAIGALEDIHGEGSREWENARMEALTRLDTLLEMLDDEDDD